MYDQKKRLVVGLYDGEPISSRYLNTIRGCRKQLQALTPTERIFEEKVAKVIQADVRTPYITQRTFFITDQIAFIADFYFKKFKLAIELDGQRHHYANEKVRDEWRSQMLKEHAGVTVLRFSNRRVAQDINGVFGATVQALGNQENGTPSVVRHLRKVYAHYFTE